MWHNSKTMLWVDKIVSDICKNIDKCPKSNGALIVRDEKTVSGKVHVGSMRGVAIHSIISDTLNDEGVKSKFLYEINDFDPMDDVPSYLDQNLYKQHLGKRLEDVPSPDGKAKNFAEYYAKDYIEVIQNAEFDAEFYRLSDVYKSGKMDKAIDIALRNAQKIREIYKRVSGSEKPNDWLPLNVKCKHCGKISATKVTSFDGNKVTYTCMQDAVNWMKGCGYSGEINPFGGNGSLPWKVEWAAKFAVFNVAIEGGGKDHCTKGGSRDVANAIAREVFNITTLPYNVPYEFFLIGGAKMSSSKGRGSSAREVSDLLPKKIFRFLLLSKKPMQAINFDPGGDTIPVLFDQYDKIAKSFWNGDNDDFTRLFELVHKFNPPKSKMYLPRFSIVAVLSQMPHVNIENEFAKMKGQPLNDEELSELRERIAFAKRWLEKYAPEKYVFKLQNKLPESAKNLSNEQKHALALLLDFVKNSKEISGQEMHTKLHDIKRETNINPKDLFGAIYLILLGKDNGPKAGWFLSVLDKKMLCSRLEEALNTSV